MIYVTQHDSTTVHHGSRISLPLLFKRNSLLFTWGNSGKGPDPSAVHTRTYRRFDLKNGPPASGRWGPGAWKSCIIDFKANMSVRAVRPVIMTQPGL